jgi:16S rRNA (guanine966-N2)-methyltransferase
MRIVAGAWRGRTLVAPPGQKTRPTADRVRQALFDTLLHAEWGGRSVVEGAEVMDVFAGTGALGLEALSRGASWALFIESGDQALRALQANIAACKAQGQTRVLASDAIDLPRLTWPGLRSSPGTNGRSARPPAPFAAGRPGCPPDTQERNTFVPARRIEAHGTSASLVFLDPPYGRDLVPRTLSRLRAAGWIGKDALIVAETSRTDTWVPEQPLLSERHYGAARIIIFRA